ncbi:MAG: hypothetical protein RL209_531 [Pseudomonadota bacterium]
MSEALIRQEPVSETPFVAEGIRISLAPPMQRHALRARNPEDLESLLKVKLPTKVGTFQRGILCLGPDEWYLRSAMGKAIPTGEGLPLAVTDISERSICLIVEGPRASEILMAGCPLDLDQFAVGRATRTIYETVEIIVMRDAEDRFHVEVWRSFAAWLWMAMTTAARH